MSTATLPSTRWSINPEVIDSPACSMPEYAGYRTRYYLVSGSTVSTAADTREDILDRAKIWATRSARIVRVPVVPYYDALNDPNEKGRAVGRPAWTGGTWGGKCGSAIWVHDTDRRYQRSFRALRALGSNECYMQSGTVNYDVATLQAWWINGISDRYPALDGFWLECRQAHKHLGPCAALDRTWNWRDYAPWCEHDTQPYLF